MKIRKGTCRALASVFIAFFLTTSALAETPIPSVDGPLESTDASHPFGAAAYQRIPQDLSNVGYLEEEYLISGNANVYTWPAPGAAQIRTPAAPYTTRVLVRRPSNPARFSGNVVIEMLNPSNNFDLNIGWALAQGEIKHSGDAWIGVTIKPVSADALRNFDSRRYGSISLANPLPLSDPANCEVDPPDTRSTERGLAWDIYSQVAAWVQSDVASNPFLADSPSADSANDSRKSTVAKNSRRNTVERVYGFGYSQTGGYMYNYINGIQPLVVERNGESLFDGYIVAVAGGAFAGAYPMNQCEAAPPLDDPRRQFRNVGVPIIHVMSQSDYLIGIGSRRADSDSDIDPYRHYEMAGAAHATPDELYYSAASEDILAADRSVPPIACNEGRRSRFPSSIHFNAMLQNLDDWVRNGTPPPRSDFITVVNGEPVLDQYGNVMGGLRSPFVDVPTSTWHASATGASFCFIAGWEEPFSDERLLALYPNHGEYVKQVRYDINRLVDRRFLTPSDAFTLFRKAARADVP